MKIDELISELEKIKKTEGNLEVAFSFNGVTESGELCNITEINTTGFFPTDEGMVSTDDFIPGPFDKVTKVVNLFSNRDKYD